MNLYCTATDDLYHPRLLLKTERWRGSIEIKCPACKRITQHGDEFAGADVRCPGSFKNKGIGWCGRLAFRISHSASGIVRYTCQNCGVRRTLRIDAPAMALST